MDEEPIFIIGPNQVDMYFVMLFPELAEKIAERRADELDDDPES